ncbi:hypothetical protein GWO43_16290 [candidate division KSB1 bacterium]|nr:hypothetical protein [candidate division KSB1 bacterium]NIT72403.1 hypothetical protein [candidate division KSB1 bacterium]NIX72083.1 hypothetical protein [candidate division KSB1 bacterium]
MISVTLMLFVACSNQTLTKKSESYPFQEEILEYIFSDSLRSDGTFPYYWPRVSKDTLDTLHLGTTTNIDYLGTRISAVRENRGTHCVGVTWQVCMTTLQEWAGHQGQNAIYEMTVDDVRRFADKWFIKLEDANGLASLSTPEEMGAVHALTVYGLGRQVAFEEARPGDFVQFWRTDDSGHSCIFLNWVYDGAGEIVGFRYWGSQPQTNGIGTDTEYFVALLEAEPAQRLVNRKRFYVGRLAPERD